jgi:zinc/manganese transport system substrate-binding protein
MTALPRRLLLAALPALVAAPVRAADAMPAVASFSILADMLGEVAGERWAVRSLAGPDQELHGFEPRPSDLVAVGKARLLAVNGLGLEGWADRMASAAGFTGTRVVASRGVNALKAGHAHGHSHGHSHGHGHAHGGLDPHAWQSVANAKIYVGNLRDGLGRADPAGAAEYAAAAGRYIARLDALDGEIRALFAPIPKAQRRVVTSHEAFAYFAAAYGVEMLAVAGTWREAEPSAKELAALAAQVKRQKIRALFIESAGSGTGLRALAGELGLRIGGTLYADALSPPGGPAATYVDMMRHNATTIAAALR